MSLIYKVTVERALVYLQEIIYSVNSNIVTSIVFKSLYLNLISIHEI